MKIKVDTEPANLLLRSQRGEKKFAFAVVNAINTAAKEVQKKIVAQGRRDLNIRKPFAQRQLAIIKPFASVGKQIPFAEISVGQKERLLLPELATPETEERKPFTPGAKRVAIPIVQGQPRAKFKGSIPKELFFANLKLKRWPRGTKPGSRGLYPEEEGRFHQTIWRGRQRTFMIPSVGVFQRFGSGKSDTRPLFIFDPHVPIHQRLEFVEIAQREGPIEIQRAMDDEIKKEIIRGL